MTMNRMEVKYHTDYIKEFKTCFEFVVYIGCFSTLSFKDENRILEYWQDGGTDDDDLYEFYAN